MTFTRAVSSDELWEGELCAVVLNGVPIVLVRWGDEVVAFEDRCAHRGVRISGGCLSGHVVTCPAHEWSYDVRTGKGMNPASARLRRLPVLLEEGVIYVKAERQAVGTVPDNG
jgi:toluene monooxygenase system ferredoxin subunit